MNREVFKDADHLCKGLAEWITSLIEETLTRKEKFGLVLSGGNTPKKLHELLAFSPYEESIDWKKIHVFWGDERAVPFEDDRNNARMAFDTLLEKVDVPTDQIILWIRAFLPKRQSWNMRKSCLNILERMIYRPELSIWYCLEWETMAIHFPFSRGTRNS